MRDVIENIRPILVPKSLFYHIRQANDALNAELAAVLGFIPTATEAPAHNSLPPLYPSHSFHAPDTGSTNIELVYKGSADRSLQYDSAPHVLPLFPASIYPSTQFATSVAHNISAPGTSATSHRVTRSTALHRSGVGAAAHTSLSIHTRSTAPAQITSRYTSDPYVQPSTCFRVEIYWPHEEGFSRRQSLNSMITPGPPSGMMSGITVGVTPNTRSGSAVFLRVFRSVLPRCHCKLQMSCR